tara:strand:+ start:394 stop:1767 length:1374 start_codon:yes stop_codon:yes gene_type:complete
MLRVDVHRDASANSSAPEELHRQSSISALMELRHGKPTPPLEPTASFLGSLSNEDAPPKKGKRRTPARERAQKPKVAKETRASRTSKPVHEPQPLLLSESFCAELSTSKSFCAELCTSLSSPRAALNLMPPPLSHPCSLLGTYNLMPPLSCPGSFASSFGVSSSSFGSSFTASSSAFPSTPPSLYSYLSPVVSSTNLLSPIASKALEKGLGGGSTHDTYGSPLGSSPPAANESDQPVPLMLSESFFRALDKPLEGAAAHMPTHAFAPPLGCIPTSTQALEKDLWACTSFAAPMAMSMAHRQMTPQKSLDGSDTPAQRHKWPLPVAVAVPIPWTYYAPGGVPAASNRLPATDLMGQLGSTDLMGQRGFSPISALSAPISPENVQKRPAGLTAGVREVGIGGAAQQQHNPKGASNIQILELVACWQASLQALLARGDLAENNHRLLDPVAKCADPAYSI